MLRRLWDSWEDDAEIRDAATGRFVDRDKLHYIDFEGAHFSVRGPSITPRPPQGQPVVAALAHRDVAFRLVGRSADIGFVTPRDAADAAAILATVRAEQDAAGRGGETVHVLGDVVVFLDESAAAAAERKERLDGLLGRDGSGHEYVSDAHVFVGTPAELADLALEWQAAGLSGLRLRPGTLPVDLTQITRGLVPGAAAARRLPHRVRGRHPARACSACPAPPTATPPLPALSEEYRCRASRSTSPRTSPASTTPPSGATRRPAARSSSPRSCTSPGPPSAGSSTSCSSPRACGCASRAARSTTSTSSAAPTRSPCSPRSPPSPTASASPARSTRRSTSPTRWPASSPRSTTCPPGGPAWNVVTSWDAFTGENFRRGGFLPQEKRYDRAREFLAATRVLFDSWRGDEIVADAASGTFVADPDAGRFAVHSEQFDIGGRFTVPRSPQGRPVILQAGDSEEGREFAAADADAIFTRHATLEDGRAFYADVKGRLARYGRSPDDLKILPATTFVLGDTDAEAREKAHVVRGQQVSRQTAIKFAEQVWNRDLSDRDPDGPLPAEDPVVGENTISQGRASVRMYRDPVATANEWRALAEAKKLSLRELVIEKTSRQNFIGTPAAVAAAMDEFVQTDASDGFILVPHITPGGLDEFVDTVVPLLQERGSFRTEYTGTTLREHLGLRPPA